MNGFKELSALAQELGCTVKENEPMSLHTTFKIGGKASLYIEPDSPQSFKELVKKANELGISLSIVGNGSNMLVCDDDIDMVFINLSSAFNGIELIDDTTIICGAGVNLSRLCTFAYEHSLTGLEFACGIPGTVGGAAFMNAGAYEGELGSVILSCSHLTKEGEEGVLQKDDIKFSYRYSAYKDNGFTITHVTVRLRKGDKNEIKDKIDDFMQRRRAKQPIQFPSAGSFFKRPTGNFAGKLIEECGLKGTTVGGAQISEKHAGFIINIGNATCKDVLELMELTQKRVFDETGVILEPEVLMIK